MTWVNKYKEKMNTVPQFLHFFPMYLCIFLKKCCIFNPHDVITFQSIFSTLGSDRSKKEKFLKPSNASHEKNAYFYHYLVTESTIQSRQNRSV